MKKLLFSTVALTLLAAMPAKADIAVAFQLDGGAIVPVDSTPGNVIVTGNIPFPILPPAIFQINAINAFAAGGGNVGDLLNSQTLNVSLTGPPGSGDGINHTLNVFVTAFNLSASQAASGVLDSQFDVVGLTPGWENTVTSFASLTNALFTGTMLSSIDFMAPAAGVGPFATNFLPNGLFSVTEMFSIQTHGLNGSTNSGADITAAVVPVPGAVWLFGGGLAGLGAMLRRRKKTMTA